jgi:hypothetical protein
MDQQKESYTEPVLVAHELLRDITGIAVSGRVVCKGPDAVACVD